ncbi:hypothetical protein B0H13DRAFT_1858838 [Mycena leptocephala]|nr:hypothetical protein B0H13DRAFT_1858838 [Mycena leptocephala]
MPRGTGTGTWIDDDTRERHERQGRVDERHEGKTNQMDHGKHKKRSWEVLLKLKLNDGWMDGWVRASGTVHGSIPYREIAERWEMGTSGLRAAVEAGRGAHGTSAASMTHYRRRWLPVVATGAHGRTHAYAARAHSGLRMKTKLKLRSYDLRRSTRGHMGIGVIEEFFGDGSRVWSLESGLGPGARACDSATARVIWRVHARNLPEESHGQVDVNSNSEEC